MVCIIVVYWTLSVAVMVVDCARHTLDQIAATGAGLRLPGIVGGNENEGQPPGSMYIAFTEGRRVEYETHAYYQDRSTGCWREVRCSDGWRKCS